MEFGLSEDQKILVESVNRYCVDQISLDRVRASAKLDEDDPDIWQGLAKLGLPGLMVPEEAGGTELSLLDAALVSEALGYYVAPEHFFGSILASIALLSGKDSTALAQIASGQLIVGTGITDAIWQKQDVDGLSFKEGYISGKTLFVRDFGTAQALLLCTASHEVLWVENLSTIKERRLTTIDRTRRYSEITCERTPATVLAEGEEGRKLTQEILSAGRVLIAADSLGVAQAMLDKAVSYSLERKQFNRVIGSFQAVKHMCAEMAAELEPCRALLWYAAHCHQQVPEEFALLACHLKAHLGEVTRFIARTATEVHGGMGFTDLMGLHFWFKRIGLDRQLLGGPMLTREEAARLSGYCDAA